MIACHVQGFCQSATNNVIWRLVTGRRTNQDDPQLKELTERLSEGLRHFDPGSLLGLLQINSVTFTRSVQAKGGGIWAEIFMPLSENSRLLSLLGVSN